MDKNNTIYMGQDSEMAADKKPCYDELASPEDIILTCANCGERMREDRCKLRCECGYFASCSDYY